LRPVEIEGSQQLQEVVSNVVERFRRDTGISARFVPSGRVLNLPPATALEMVRIIQEALVNVRKHSGGQNVLVRIESIESDACRLTIEDDGRGFEFEGRVNDSEMARQRIGPAIIRERARIANAGLVVESVKGQGARLELTFGGAAS
jgi:two-component system nitrate/nitrite sensor histidine kinase NarX